MTNWFFIVHNLKHLSGVNKGDESWWCVDRRCTVGDQAFIYQPLNGVVLLLKMLELLKTPEPFCDSYQMSTARIKALKIFDPPITSKQLKSSRIVSSEGFVRRNFQAKSFVVHSEETPSAILALAKKTQRSVD